MFVILGSIGENVEVKKKYDETIMQSEHAYLKILESSQTLLHQCINKDNTSKHKMWLLNDQSIY